MTQLWRLEAIGPRARIDPVADVLSEADPAPALAVSLFDVDGVSGQRRLEALLDHPPDLDAIALAWNLADPAITLTAAPLPDANWVAQSLEGLPPVRAGRFIIHGDHHTPPKSGAVAVRINAGTAFGTGHHGTTRGCLLALDAIVKRGHPQRVLDIGTGAGVLAIAAAKVVRRPVSATDIDPASVAFAIAAAKANAVAPLIRTLMADGLGPFATQRYDLVMANILAGPLITLAPAVASVVAPHGQLIVSGLLSPQARSVRAAYHNRGLRLIRYWELEGWATLLMGKA